MQYLTIQCNLNREAVEMFGLSGSEVCVRACVCVCVCVYVALCETPPLIAAD